MNLYIEECVVFAYNYDACVTGRSVASVVGSSGVWRLRIGQGSVVVGPL